jgi:glycosyltransferase involved in cell wall biosynthesis
MRLKILEAFARGIPVVSTSIGCDGIRVEHGRHLLIADTPAEFADRVVELLESPRLGESLARHARALVTSTYDWRVVLPALDGVYDEGSRVLGF